MAGMFLSLKEAAAKLNITEEQVQQLVRDGKLREFRDGANVLFKVDEVEALVGEMPKAELEEVSLPEVDEAVEISAEAEPAEPEVEAGGDTALAAEAPVEEEEELKAEPAELEVEAGGDTALGPEAPVEKEEEIEAKSAELEAEPEEVLEVSAAEGAAKAPEAKPEEALEEPDLLMEAEAESETAKAPSGGKEGEGEEVALGLGESEDSGTGEELAEAETVAGTEGLNVLGETDIELEGAADTGAETKSGSGEASLEEIEEDVNLDSFGSGSGLLDLSLQADDTSLGGILDEIYTAEGEQDTTEGPALELGAEAEEAGEVEQEELVGPEPVLEALPAAPVYVEAAPDKLSNAFGIVLLVPLLAILYTAIVAVAGFSDLMPAVLEKLQSIKGPGGLHIIWYVGLVLALAGGAIVGGAYMLGGAGGEKGQKPKVKKAEKEKVKKPKKVKPKKKKSSEKG